MKKILNLILGLVVMLGAYWEGYVWGDWVDKNAVSDFPGTGPVFLIFVAGLCIIILSLIEILSAKKIENR